MHVKTTVVMLAVIALGGCATLGGNKQSETVTDADLGRLTPDQMGPVNQARQARAAAADAKARAQLALEQSEHEQALAKADDATATADAEKAKAQEQISADNRDPAALQRSQELRDRATLSKAQAEAHKNYADKLKDARQAAVDTAQRQIDLADAKLELAKLTALRQGDVPAATKYDAAKLQSKVNDAQKRADDDATKQKDAEAQASNMESTWKSARQQLQAKTGGANNAG